MKLPEKLKESGHSMKFRDNTPLYYGMKVLRDNFQTVIDARFYASVRGVIYCCVWVSRHPHYGRGVGVASGYGYHKLSAALSSALFDMGIILEGDERCSCVGEDAMRHTLTTLGELLTGEHVYIVEFHR